MIFSSYGIYRNSHRNDSKANAGPSRLSHLLAPALVAILWMVPSGIGSFGTQTSDYDKHNAMFHDLLTQPWPVSYFSIPTPDHTTSKATPLVYYIAYYIPAALVGRASWPELLHPTEFIYAGIGVWLALAWFRSLSGVNGGLAYVLFVFFSGMDFLGQKAIVGHFSLGTSNIEFWSKTWQYSSNTSLLYWVPQHAIAGWLATSLILHDTLTLKTSRNVGYYFALALPWTPFATIGLLPLVVINVAMSPVRQCLSARNLLGGGGLASVFGLYYLSRFPDTHSGWIWVFSDFTSLLPALLTFELLEFGIYSLVCAIVLRRTPNRFFVVFLASAVTLVLIPLYKMGIWNDFAMRASIPSLFVICLAIAKVIGDKPNRRQMPSLVLVACLGIGAICPIREIVRPLLNWREGPFPKRSVVEQPPDAAIQYIGDENSFFFKHLSKPLLGETLLPEQLQDKPMIQNYLGR
ncbi:MAG: hypothetical protein ACOYM3_21725 [Terrimicrobiaceae bacterium]